MKTGLYLCRVMHRRTTPAAHRFVHHALGLLLDIDRLDTAQRDTRLFSVDRVNLVHLSTTDHGARDGGTSLRAWAEQHLATHGIARRPSQILLLCMPAVLGAGFSPLSLWFCLGTDGEPFAIIAEVHNTFGESHSYVLPASPDRSPPDDSVWPVRAHHAKVFRVSPFIGMDCTYAFRIAATDSGLRVSIRQRQGARHLLTAVLTGRQAPLDDRHLIRALVQTRFFPLKVSLAIHWQALRLWLKRVPLVAAASGPHQMEN